MTEISPTNLPLPAVSRATAGTSSERGSALPTTQTRG